jgi:hypothetical protein
MMLYGSDSAGAGRDWAGEGYWVWVGKGGFTSLVVGLMRLGGCWGWGRKREKKK